MFQMNIFKIGDMTWLKHIISSSIWKHPWEIWWNIHQFFRPFPVHWSRIQVDSFWDAKRPSDTESCFLISWYLYSLPCWSCRQQICLKRLKITEDMKLWVWSFDAIHLSFGSKHPIWKRVLIPAFVVSNAGKRATRLWPVSLRFVLYSLHLESFGLHIAAVIFRSRYKSSFASPSLSLGTRAMKLLQLRRWWCNVTWDMVAFRCYYRLVKLPIICNGNQFKDCELVMRIVILLSFLLYDMIVYISTRHCYGMVPSLLVLCSSSTSY